jgi:hypothetical protein
MRTGGAEHRQANRRLVSFAMDIGEGRRMLRDLSALR